MVFLPLTVVEMEVMEATAVAHLFPNLEFCFCSAPDCWGKKLVVLNGVKFYYIAI